MSEGVIGVAVIVLWFVITGGGFIFNLLNLFDAWRVLQWQEESGINGSRHLLAVGHLRTAVLRTVEFGAAIFIGVIGTLRVPGTEWINVILLFALVSGVSVASALDRRDRHKLTGE